jgi:hypothetical protein
VGPRTGLNDMERRKSCPYQDLNSDPLAVQPISSHCTELINLIYNMIYISGVNIIFCVGLSVQMSAVCGLN